MSDETATMDAPTSEVDATTARILDATYDLLLTFGLRRTSVEDVARRAGVARISVYRRFGGKDELIRTVLFREARRVFAEVDAVVGGIDDTDELVEGFAAILQAARSHPLLQRLLDIEADATVASLTIHGGRVVALGREYLAGHFARAQAAGRLGPFDADALAEILVRLTLSFLLTPDSVVRLSTADDARAFARQFVLPSVYAGAASPAPA